MALGDAFGASDSQGCPGCASGVETDLHVLLFCPLYSKARAKWIIQLCKNLGLGLQGDVQDLKIRHFPIGDICDIKVPFLYVVSEKCQIENFEIHRIRDQSFGGPPHSIQPKDEQGGSIQLQTLGIIPNVFNVLIVQPSF